MRAQKISIRVSFYISIISLILLIVLHSCNILMSIFSGLFASSLLSLSVCICNYLVLQKNIVETLVISAYKIKADGYSCLFSTEKDLSLEKAQIVLNILIDRFHSVYVNNHELLIGLFWFNKAKNDIKNLEKRIENQIIKIFSIESYIELYESEAKEQTKQIYNDLNEIIDDNKIYNEFLIISKKFGGSFKKYDSEEEKQKSADKYKKSSKIVAKDE